MCLLLAMNKETPRYCKALMLQHIPSEGKGRNGVQHSMVSTANGEPVQTRGLVPGILLSILGTLAFLF